MNERYTNLPLPDDVKRLIDEPLVPFEQLQPYHQGSDLYELDERDVSGADYKVHQFMRKIGGEVMVVTRVETRMGASIFEVDTPKDKVTDRLNHTFPAASEELIEFIFPNAA